MERQRPQPDINMPEYGLGALTIEDAIKLTKAIRTEYGDEIREDEDWFAQWVIFYQAKKKELGERREA